MIYTFIFYLFGIIAVVSAIIFVTRQSPVAAALWLVNTMFCLAALYVMLDAQFIGAIQVLVYAGAIMVVFLFVIMLLNLGHPDQIADRRGLGWRLLGGAAGVALIAMLLTLAKPSVPPGLALPADFGARQVQEAGAVAPVAAPLFREHLLAFEITSVLLLAAMIGAVLLGKQRRSVPDAG